MQALYGRAVVRRFRRELSIREKEWVSYDPSYRTVFFVTLGSVEVYISLASDLDGAERVGRVIRLGQHRRLYDERVLSATQTCIGRYNLTGRQGEREVR